MVELERKYLIKRNSRDKIQVNIIVLSEEKTDFIIDRYSFQFGCKTTQHPRLTIDKGLAGRSKLQQAKLKYQSLINGYMNKGSKLVNDFIKKTEEELFAMCPSIATDANGEKQAMKAQPYQKCQTSVVNKRMLCSKKIDGVRCMFRLKDGDVISVSRGGKDYQVPTTKLRKILLPILQNHPDYILDGEIYKKGMYLQTISGIARRKTWDEDCDILEYWIYDLAIPDVVFEDRMILLDELRKELEPHKDKIKVLNHFETNSWSEMEKLHDEFVEEGFEGLVARKPDKEYQFGKRNSCMVKVKKYQDDEFLIVDYKEGDLREEDFCFVCETKEHKLFTAKPIGGRRQIKFYLNHIDEIIDCGRYGTVKFFNWSKEGIPTQPIFKCIRNIEDLDLSDLK